MTPQEFRSWFEGFTESMDEEDRPTQKQWDKIKKKVKEIYFPYYYQYGGYFYQPYNWPYIPVTYQQNPVNLTTTCAMTDYNPTMTVTSTSDAIFGLNACYTQGKIDYT